MNLNRSFGVRDERSDQVLEFSLPFPLLLREVIFLSLELQAFK
jgi:hypothetical protein